MYARMNLLIGDPARIDDLTRYLEETVRPHVEAQPGCRGMAILTDAELGQTLVGSYWDTAEALATSEQAVQTSRKEAVEMTAGAVTVDEYEVPVFLRLSHPRRGAGIRIAMIEGTPGQLDETVRVFRERGLPVLRTMRGLCSAQVLTDRDSGRCLIITAYDDKNTLRASRADVARMRADALATTQGVVRSVQEFTLVSSTVRADDAAGLTRREVERWNAHDRAGWQSLYDPRQFEVVAPGGVRLSGAEGLDAFWDTWNEAFPDSQIIVTAIHEDATWGVLEARFTGTHTGVLRGPAGEIPPTGRTLDARFCNINRMSDGRIMDIHLYFDQVDLMTQLGLS
ncbi:ester cyclase [Amycolatopsis sp. GM8]|uniref:ester cyclase n=1 Tax=Amycolatopsis sp. GM8 TaxID=2896530 RepID=UPI001F004AC6|nr:ester cyclase [Amycolatopsis sp. GM8]